ncbi:hypothetical protein B0A55_10704 [Friedmanniomyces simplex]|uniref:CCHC-type domain-containing protein n=1 Tax=Friedmanniomyces simplex TaxID=329884 RepID=A0A4V5NFY7_9PEZI|nr:hypothetical protein B0A55_10704 [Friedmanniomyces simplex]
MSGWDTTPAPAADGGFQADNSFKAVTGTKDGKDFRFAVENISRHADGEVGEAPHDGGCRNCGDPSHFGRDCPTKPDQGCFNCGEAGHMKSECTNERVEREFTGTCLACGLAGHRRAECSDAPAQTCNICKQLDHKASECTVSRMTAYIDSLNIEELPPDVAWKALEAADQDRDVDDIKRAILAYAKVVPNITFEEFEKVFRSSGFNTYIIAKQQAVADTHTIVQFQGVTDQEFVWSIQFSPDPRRKMSVGGWPATLEINLERLKKTGIAMDRMVPKCSNCEQLGHNSRGCPEEKREVQKNRISCANW